jgi:hypothetical protein
MRPTVLQVMPMQIMVNKDLIARLALCTADYAIQFTTTKDDQLQSFVEVVDLVDSQ